MKNGADLVDGGGHIEKVAAKVGNDGGIDQAGMQPGIQGVGDLVDIDADAPELIVETEGSADELRAGLLAGGVVKKEGAKGGRERHTLAVRPLSGGGDVLYGTAEGDSGG